VGEVVPGDRDLEEREATYRRGSPDDDDARARIMSEALPALSVTPSALREWEGQIRADDDGHLSVWVAVAQGEVVGTCVLRRRSWLPAGTYQVATAVTATARGRGIGGELYRRVETQAVERGATRFEAMSAPADDASLAWARRRGYTLWREITESILDLGLGIPPDVEARVAEVEAAGIRLVTLAEIDTPPMRRQVYELCRTADRDVPMVPDDHEFMEFDAWERYVFGGATIRADASWIALDGEVPVGLSALSFASEGTARVQVEFTGVLPSHRRRGIALALKAMSVRWAAATGYREMVTENDPDNPAILGANEKLGFRVGPGPRLLRKTL
jgi:RimJ/RimL family protein N-acetyltransferase